MARKGRVVRKTKETEIQISLNLEGSGRRKIATSIAFLDHMLALFCAHGMLDLELKAKGDTHVDYHHTVEDIGITLGDALQEALGKKRRIARYGSAFVPMDESLAAVHIDISGRPHLRLKLPLRRRKIGDFDTELVKEFFQAFANHAALTLHAEATYGDNAHHMVEALFKAFGRALRQAVTVDPQVKGVPSTKGRL
jgi:imidazoleglycerol-phosphate dehydratase